MSEPTCELRFGRFEPSERPIHVGRGLRVLFVVRGSVSIESDDGDWPEHIAAEHAALGEGPFSLKSDVGDSVVLSWQITAPAEAEDDAELRASLDLDPAGRYLIRCDRVDFPPGGEALLHTHRGPGIRCLLVGELDVTVAGRTKHLLPLDPWFESGPEPVYAAASQRESTAFVRVMVLPESLLGESSIRYVREEDVGKPKSQRYTVYIDEPADLLLGNGRG